MSQTLKELVARGYLTQDQVRKFESENPPEWLRNAAIMLHDMLCNQYHPSVGKNSSGQLPSCSFYEEDMRAAEEKWTLKGHIKWVEITRRVLNNFMLNEAGVDKVIGMVMKAQKEVHKNSGFDDLAKAILYLVIKRIAPASIQKLKEAITVLVIELPKEEEE
jgi:hypothetical protein